MSIEQCLRRFTKIVTPSSEQQQQVMQILIFFVWKWSRRHLITYQWRLINEREPLYHLFTDLGCKTCDVTMYVAEQ